MCKNKNCLTVYDSLTKKKVIDAQMNKEELEEMMKFGYINCPRCI